MRAAGFSVVKKTKKTKTNHLKRDSDKKTVCGRLKKGGVYALRKATCARCEKGLTDEELAVVTAAGLLYVSPSFGS